MPRQYLLGCNVVRIELTRRIIFRILDHTVFTFFDLIIILILQPRAVAWNLMPCLHPFRMHNYHPVLTIHRLRRPLSFHKLQSFTIQSAWTFPPSNAENVPPIILEVHDPFQITTNSGEREDWLSLFIVIRLSMFLRHDPRSSTPLTSIKATEVWTWSSRNIRVEA